MSHTGSSWTLKGHGFATACLCAIGRVRPYIPSHFHIQTVFPGHTLGGYYGLHYEDSPIGPYDELIVFPALVTFGGKVGCYVSHSFVNSERALQGGFESWRWPRQLRRIAAKFENRQWRFELYEAGQVSFAARGRVFTPAFPFNFSLPFIDDSGGQVIWYSGLFDTQVYLSTARPRMSSDCPFGRLHRAKRLLSVSFKSLNIVLGEPSMIKARPIGQPAYAAPAVSTTQISNFESRTPQSQVVQPMVRSSLSSTGRFLWLQ